MQTQTCRFYQFDEEQTYYSPNCTDDVYPPRKSREEDSGNNIFLSEIKMTKPFRSEGVPASGTQGNPIKYNFAAIFLADYQKPRWWTRLWGWTCFIPTKVIFDGILKSLCSARRPVKLDDSEYYSMIKEDICDWIRLENDLHRFYQILEKHLLLGLVCPALPWVFGYRKKYRSFSRALQAMERSRDWFMVWVGLISYAIAKAETEEQALMKYPNLRIASWYEAAIIGGCNAAWLDGLMFSCIYAFDGRVRRTGIFLHPDSQKEEQPAVEWFLEFSIPVWFPYTSKIDKHPQFAQGKPSASQLRALPQPYQRTEQSVGVAPTWISFFEARTIKIQEMIRSAGRDDLYTWNVRRRQKGASDASVYEWKENSYGEWVRVKLTGRLAEKALLDYRASQTIYCPYFNEYDCCQKFVAVPMADEDEREETDFDKRTSTLSPDTHWIRNEDETGDNFIDEEGEGFAYSTQDIYEGNQLSNPHQESFIIRHRGTGYSSAPQLTTYPRLLESSPSNNSTIPDIKDRIVLEITDVLRLYFGFTGGFPNPLVTTELSIKRTTTFLTILGFKWQQEWHEAICNVPSIQVAEAFIHKLASGNLRTALPEDEENWDLSYNHRECVALRRRFSCIRRLEPPTGKPLFLFDFGCTATTSWKLAVTKASDALMICRLDDKMNELDISQFLLCNGIPFRTLLPTSLLRRSRSGGMASPTVLPIRREDHTFTVHDYEAFQARLLDFLESGKRARAALMRGGYTWRLSARDVKFNDVESGPVGWCLNREEMFIINDPLTGEELMDDALTPVEEDLICGSYRCLTGQGDQKAFKSWFPDPYIFEQSGVDYGRWTELSEKLYRQIIENTGSKYRADEPIEQPKSSRKWRGALHGKGFLRRALHTVECLSTVLLLNEHRK